MISDRDVGGVLSGGLQETTRTGAGPTAGAGSAAQADGVTFSRSSAAMKQWLARLRDLPEVRTDRIAQVTADLAAGNRPEALAVARQILSGVPHGPLSGGSGHGG